MKQWMEGRLNMYEAYYYGINTPDIKYKLQDVEKVSWKNTNSHLCNIDKFSLLFYMPEKARLGL